MKGRAAARRAVRLVIPVKDHPSRIRSVLVRPWPFDVMDPAPLIVLATFVRVGLDLLAPYCHHSSEPASIMVRRAPCACVAGRAWRVLHIGETDCVAGVVRLELRNPLGSKSARIVGEFLPIWPKRRSRDSSRRSCGVANVQLWQGFAVALWGGARVNSMADFGSREENNPQ
jgi:hypothetical protein